MDHHNFIVDEWARLYCVHSLQTQTITTKDGQTDERTEERMDRRTKRLVKSRFCFLKPVVEKRQNIGAAEEIEKVADDVVLEPREHVPQQRLMLPMQLHQVVHVDGPFGEAQDDDDLVELVEFEAEEVAFGGASATSRSST